MSPAISYEKQRLIDTLMEHVTSAPTPTEVCRRAKTAIALLLLPKASPQAIPLLEGIVADYTAPPEPNPIPDFGRSDFEDRRKKMIAAIARKLLNALIAGGDDAEKVARVRQLLEPLSLLSESVSGPTSSPLSRKMARSLEPTTSLVESTADAADFRKSIVSILEQAGRSAAEKIAAVRSLAAAHTGEPLQESQVFAAGAYPESKNPFVGK